MTWIGIHLLGTGNSVIKALEILIQQDVDESKVIVLSLFTTPEGLPFLFITVQSVLSPVIEWYDFWNFSEILLTKSVNETNNGFSKFTWIAAT